jgi:hypothetical protein
LRGETGTSANAGQYPEKDEAEPNENRSAAIFFGGVNHLLTILGRTCARGGRNACRFRGFLKMNISWNHRHGEPGSFAGAARLQDSCEDDLLIANCLASAALGDIEATYTLGVAFSTGSHGVGCNLIEAHKWFNLAAVKGHAESQMCRADISDEMTAREIAEAQRRAREWIAQTTRRAA